MNKREVYDRIRKENSPFCACGVFFMRPETLLEHVAAQHNILIQKHDLMPKGFHPRFNHDVQD